MSDGAWKGTAKLSAVIATYQTGKPHCEADFALDNRHIGPKLLTLEQRCDRWGVKPKAKDGV
jgi:hypothetical protein